MVIEWSEEDDAFVVTMPDLRGCRTHGATREEAPGRGEEAIASMLAAITDEDGRAPEPRFTALDDAIYARATERRVAS
jgi:predicted RNase H-like HicB family nuclease